MSRLTTVQVESIPTVFADSERKLFDGGLGDEGCSFSHFSGEKSRRVEGLRVLVKT